MNLDHSGLVRTRACDGRVGRISSEQGLGTENSTGIIAVSCEQLSRSIFGFIDGFTAERLHVRRRGGMWQRII